MKRQLLVFSLFFSACAFYQLASASQLLSDAEKVALLNLHNVERCDAPDATFMPAMYWDTQLETIALQWMESCSSRGPTSYRLGANSAMGSAGQTALELAGLWVAEKAQWNYSRIPFTNYTQMIFAHSMRLGCALTACSNTGGVQLGCVYSPSNRALFMGANAAPYPRPGKFVGSTNLTATACSATKQTLSALTPYCSTLCQYGGVCTSFEFCTCASVLFRGPFCEMPVSDDFPAASDLPNMYSSPNNCNEPSDCIGPGVLNSCCATFVSWGFGLTCAIRGDTPRTWSKDKDGCFYPSCSCKNGGICVDTNLCSCPLGFSGAQCETVGPPSSTTTTTSTARPTTTTISSASTVPRSTTTTAAPVQAIGLTPSFDIGCTAPYGDRIYVKPSPSCITLGVARAQVSVKVSCSSYAVLSPWSMQLWTGPQCNNGDAINLNGQSMGGAGVNTCTGRSLDNGAATISFQIDCTVGNVDPGQITSGAAYLDAGNNTSSAPSSIHANAVLTLFAAMSVTVAAQLL